MTICNETICNETICNETICNETICNETIRNETIRNDHRSTFRPQERMTSTRGRKTSHHNNRSVTPNGATPANQPLFVSG
jgi:hypothetical protein